jgi:DNA-binding response OmpR family regulator
MASDALTDSRHGEAIVNRILLVEDEPETAEFIKTLLESQRYEVHIAKDGGQAQASFVMKKPDFVILDLILPGESGFEICERFKLTDKEIPILILSEIELEDSIALAKRVGSDGYITKPFEPNELFTQIREIATTMWNKTHGMEGSQSTEERRIRFSCKCGKRFKVSPTHRGKTLTCPDCGEPVTVPRHE